MAGIFDGPQEYIRRARDQVRLMADAANQADGFDDVRAERLAQIHRDFSWLPTALKLSLAATNAPDDMVEGIARSEFRRKAFKGAWSDVGDFVKGTAARVSDAADFVTPEKVERFIGKVKDQTVDPFFEDPVTRSIARTGFAALQTGQEYIDASTRMIAEETREDGWIQGLLKTGKVVVGLDKPGREDYTLGQMVEGEDAGQGFLPGGDAAKKQAEHARTYGTINGEAITIGRLGASTIFQPGSKPYNALSGFIDIVPEIVDPVGYALEGAAKTAKASRNLTNVVSEGAVVRAANKADDAWRADVESVAGLVSGGNRRTVVPAAVDKWLFSDQAQRRVERLVKETSPAAIRRMFKDRADATVVKALAEATDNRSVLEILRPAVGLSLDPKAVRGLPTVVPNVQRQVRAFNLMPDTFLPIDDPNTLIKNLDTSLANANVMGADRDEIINLAYQTVVGQPSTEGMFALANVAAKAVEKSMLAHGADPVLARELTRWTGTYVKQARYLGDESGPINLPFLKNANGDPIADWKPSALYQLINRGVSLYQPSDIREIRQLTSAFNRVGIHSGTVQYPNAVLDFMQNGVWKLTAMVRPAYFARVNGEEIVRSNASGVFDNPVDWMAYAFGHSAMGDARGNPFDIVQEGDEILERLPTLTGAEARTAQKRLDEIQDELHEGMTAFQSAMARGGDGSHAGIDNGLRRTGIPQQVTKQQPTEWQRGVADLIVKQSNDPILRRVANGGLFDGDKVARKSGQRLFRRHTPGMPLDASERPQGLYFNTIDDPRRFVSYHVDDEEVAAVVRALDDEVLDASDVRDVGSAGERALLKIVGEDEYRVISALSDEEMFSRLEAEFPSRNWREMYADFDPRQYTAHTVGRMSRGDLLAGFLREAYAGEVARRRGFKGIVVRDADTRGPNEWVNANEFVALSDDAFEVVKKSEIPDQWEDVLGGGKFSAFEPIPEGAGDELAAHWDDVFFAPLIGMDGVREWMLNGTGVKYLRRLEAAFPEYDWKNPQILDEFLGVQVQHIKASTGEVDDLRQAIATGNINGKPIAHPNRKNRMRHEPSAPLKERISEFIDDPAAPNQVDVEVLERPGRGDPFGSVLEARQAVGRVFFGELYGVASDKLARSPVFRRNYWGWIDDHLGWLSTEARDTALANAERWGLGNEHLTRMTQRAKEMPAGTLDLDAADAYAKGWALDETNNLLFDSSQRTQFFDIARIVFPFGEAWKEVTTRWAKLLVGNPKNLRRGQQIVTGARGADLNEDGVGVFHKDPVTGEEMFSFGIDAPLMDFLGVPFVRYEGSVQGLSLGTSVIPGMGPVGQFLAAAILPDVPDTDFIARLLFPFGEPESSASGLTSQLFPGWGKKILEAWSGNEQKDVMYANTLAETVRVLATSGDYGNSEPELSRLMKDARDKARIITGMRGLISAFAPSAPQPKFFAETSDGDKVSGLLFREYAELQEQENKGEIDSAVETFIETFGDRSFVYLVGKSKSNVGGQGASREYGDWEREHNDFVNKYPAIAGYFGPEVEGYDSTVANRQTRSGRRERRDVRQSLRDAQQTVGNWMWREYKEQAGPNPGKKRRAWLREAKAEIEAKYPAWSPTKVSATSTEERIEQITRAVDDPDVSGTPVAKAVRTYLDYRQQVSDAAVERGHGETPTSFASSKKSRALRGWLREAAAEVVAEHPEFSRVWEQVFEPELADDTEED